MKSEHRDPPKIRSRMRAAPNRTSPDRREYGRADTVVSSVAPLHDCRGSEEIQTGFGETLQQAEVDFDVGGNRDRLAVLQAGLEAPLLHRFDGLLIQAQ